MPLRNQGVGLTGCVVPKYVGDAYHVTDAQWGKDGWRSVADHAARNAITTQRRREGMAVWTQSDGKLWVLDPSPWDGTDADWTEFSSSSGGTVTAVSVITANGFAGTVATNTTTPAITLKTGVTGLLLGNGTGVTAATGSDIPNIAESQVTGLTSDLATLAAAIAAAGTVTTLSVATANGFAGTVANPTTTPVLTIKTGVTGILIGNGTGVAALTVGSGLDLTGGTLTSTGSGGSVTTVSVVTANGVSGSVANPTTTPAITITLGAITPTSIVASGSITGSNLSGTNTGDQTITLTGAVTGSGTGSFATTLATSGVTYAKIQNVGAVSLLGNPTGSPAAPSEITLGSGLSFSGTTLVATGSGGTVTSVSITTANGISGTVATATTTPAITLTLGAITPTSIVASGSITGSNLSGTNTGDQTITLTGAVTGSGTGSFATTLASIATHTILANLTGGSAAPTAATPTEVLDLIGGTQGQVLYRGASAWSALGPGTSGQFLQTAGAAANPSWASLPSAGATMGGVVTIPVTVAQGGTGDTSLTAHGVLIGEGTSPVAVATIGTAGRPLLDQGAGNDPAFSSTGIKVGTHFAPETTATPGSTVTFDLSLTDRHKVTLNQATTFALSNPTTDQLFFIKVIQDSTPRAVTWFTTITWYTSTFAEPTLPQTSGKAILLAFRCTGANTYDGFVVGASGS